MKKKNGLRKDEIIYLSLSLLVIGGLVFAINNLTISSWIDSINPIFQFLLLNLGVYVVFFLLAKFISKKKKDIGNILKGSAGAILSFLALDLVLPEYHVTCQGLVHGGVFGASASDYFFGYIWQFFGVNGCALPIVVYVVTFVILFITGALLMKDFYRNLINN
jgi:hypothetical protein